MTTIALFGAAGKIGDGGRERLAREIGPKDVGHPQFGVRELVQQEIRQARFAARPDEQIGIRHVARVQVAADGVLIDRRRRKGTRRDIGRKCPRSVT